MLPILAAAAALTCQPDVAKRELPPMGRDAKAFLKKGWEQESLHTFDLNADGKADLVLIERDADRENRRLVAALATPRGYRNVGEAYLPPFPLGEADVTFTPKGVLVVVDLAGGTTANQTTMRYRYEGASAEAGAMRYIGLDIENYSRTNQHDQTSLSYNWLTGAHVRTIDRLTRRGDYLPGKPVKKQLQPACYFMEDTADPDDFLSAELGHGDSK